MQAVAGIIVYLMVFIAVKLVLYPIVWLVSLPFILVIAGFREGEYMQNVSAMLSTVTGWCTELADMLID